MGIKYYFRHRVTNVIFPHMTCTDAQQVKRTAQRLVFPDDWQIEVQHDGIIAGAINVQTWLEQQ